MIDLKAYKIGNWKLEIGKNENLMKYLCYFTQLKQYQRRGKKGMASLPMPKRLRAGIPHEEH